MKKSLIITSILYSVFSVAQTALYVPDTLSGANINLLLHKDSMVFVAGQKTKTFGVNTHKYLGPTIMLYNGSTVNMSVNNQMGDTTTIHWHGLHVAPSKDGGPHTTILPGATWNPSFPVMNDAATYWYHPHFMGKTAMHAMKGIAGMIIVKDAAEAALALPRRYGVDDFPVIVQTQQFDSMNQVMHRGMEDSLVLINGVRSNYGYTVTASLPAQVVRIRLLNAGGERNYNFGLSGNQSFLVIGSDGGLLSAPVSVTRIRLSPGERAEILVNLSGMTGQTLYLKSYGSEFPMGVQGGPTMPMPPNSPPMDSPLNGIDFNVMRINVIAQTANPVTSIPATLLNVTPYTLAQANVTRTINFTADSLMVMDGPFYFNDSTFNMMRIDYHIPLNNTEIWQLTNQTMVAHPFHLHDVPFYVLDRDGNLPPLEERGKKDVVLVYPNETVRFITKFTDFADTLVPYMFHCHILMHEDDGMMGQFVVTSGVTGIQQYSKNNGGVLVYPNPASGFVNVVLKEFNNSNNISLRIYNVLGRMIYSVDKINSASTEIRTSEFSKGIYTVEIKNSNQVLTQKLIIE